MIQTALKILVPSTIVFFLLKKKKDTAPANGIVVNYVDPGTKTVKFTAKFGGQALNGEVNASGDLWVQEIGNYQFIVGQVGTGGLTFQVYDLTKNHQLFQTAYTYA